LTFARHQPALPFGLSSRPRTRRKRGRIRPPSGSTAHAPATNAPDSPSKLIVNGVDPSETCSGNVAQSTTVPSLSGLVDFDF
jgi:hypothetical protein